jgi:hypothetical protein
MPFLRLNRLYFGKLLQQVIFFNPASAGQRKRIGSRNA